jgi:hypothetical protein
MACVVVVARRVFLQGGRIAFVISPAFDHTMTAVRLFNGFHCQTGTQPSAAGKNAAAFPSTVSTETDHLILPRQASDKHRETLNKAVFLQAACLRHRSRGARTTRTCSSSTRAASTRWRLSPLQTKPLAASSAWRAQRATARSSTVRKRSFLRCHFIVY